jgi:hypothetical protein
MHLLCEVPQDRVFRLWRTREANMNYVCFRGFVVTCVVVIGIAGNCPGDTLERAAIAAHQDQLQNIAMDCEELREYDVDPAVAETVPLRFRQTQIELKRSEAFTLSFSFLNGCAYYDRETEPSTLNYWRAKNLPAIARQTTSISATGRIEQLTDQRLANGEHRLFGGLRQLNAFSPDDTIDIAMGLRILGARRWLTKDDLGAMDEVQDRDDPYVILHASDGAGHAHELWFDPSLLFALVYYRCTSPNGVYVEIIGSDFHRQGNVFVPGKVVRSSTVLDSNGHIRHPIVFTITVKHASIADSRNTESHYSIAWPAHLQLFDARTNDPVEVGPTQRTLSDDDIRQQLAEKRNEEVALDSLVTQRMHQALGGSATTQP